MNISQLREAIGGDNTPGSSHVLVQVGEAEVHVTNAILADDRTKLVLTVKQPDPPKQADPPKPPTGTTTGLSSTLKKP